MSECGCLRERASTQSHHHRPRVKPATQVCYLARGVPVSRAILAEDTANGGTWGWFGWRGGEQVLKNPTLDAQGCFRSHRHRLRSEREADARTHAAVGGLSNA